MSICWAGPLLAAVGHPCWPTGTPAHHRRPTLLAPLLTTAGQYPLLGDMLGRHRPRWMDCNAPLRLLPADASLRLTEVGCVDANQSPLLSLKSRQCRAAPASRSLCPAHLCRAPSLLGCSRRRHAPPSPAPTVSRALSLLAPPPQLTAQGR